MRTVNRRALVLCAIAACAANAAKKPVTIDAVLNAGHGGHGRAIWSPDEARFVHEDHGDVMLYDASKRADTELFRMEDVERAAAMVPEEKQFGWRNRRVEEHSIQWSGDGRALLVAVKGDLFLWSFREHKWEQLTHTPEAEEAPEISPDGRSVAFRRAQDLYVLDVASKAVTRLTSDGSPTLLNGELDWVYPEELEIGKAFWWSPDSKRIAYMQFDVSHEFIYPQVVLTGLRAVFEPERYPQAGTPNAVVRIGVIDVSDPSRGTRWIDTGADNDVLLARVDWLRDSSRLAIQRTNRIQNRLDMLVADAASGATRTILQESDPYWINVSNVYSFLKNSDEFVWSSEKSGFRHLYLYTYDGRLERQLTDGPWEVTGITGIDEAGRRIFFVSTEASPLERQLYSVSFDGGSRTRLTEKAGTHMIDMSPGASFWLDRFSSLDSPPQTTMHSRDGRQVAVWQPQDRSFVDEYEIQPPEIVKIAASDGTPLYGKLIRPAGYQEGHRYPLVVLVYGGPQAQSVTNAWEAGWDQVLAARGFMVWSLDNRGAAGRGHAFETPLFHRFGRTELADQETGVRYLIGRGMVDPQRIGIYGWSYGGFMTTYSLLNAPELFHAGIAGAPVTNWHNYDTIYTERYLGLPSEDEAGYRDSSAVTYAAGLRSHLLILHNMEDDNVLFQNSMQLADALEKADREFAMVVYPQKSHGVTGAVRRQLMETETDFFERELK